MKATTIALVGNPNSGKTTLFNLLTKSGEAVGNRAGVTFSAKKERLRRFHHKTPAWVMDLPGIYSLSPYGNEEKAALRALKREHIDVILNIVDATNLERGLLLTSALLSLGIPTVVALNMTDELPKEGLKIDFGLLQEALGVPVFPISAAKQRGIETMIDACLSSHDIPTPLPCVASSERTSYIQAVVSRCVKKTQKGASFSDRLDAIICRPIIGIPLFFAVMLLVFFLTFSSFGALGSVYLEMIFTEISAYMRTFLLYLGVNDLACRFLTDGVWMGVAEVLSFIPQTAILFFLLAVLEDSGYLARAAFVMDDFMRRLGLSGKAIIPMLIGFGCTVPAVMSTVTMDEREKEASVMSLPFIPCNARLPVIVMIASSFFPEHTVFFAIALYFLCIVTAFLSSLLYKRKSQSITPLIMELPKYRMPQSVSLFREVKNKLRDFFIRAGTVVFLSCVIVDLMAMLTPTLRPATNGQESILAHLGNQLAPLFSPFGFADGRLIAALAAGFFAKESIVSTIQILIPEGLPAVLSPAGAVSFAVFSLLYVPCAASISAIRREMGWKKAIFCLLRTLLFALVLSYLCYTFYQFLSF